MVCQACGAPITQDVKFCSRCGAAFASQADGPASQGAGESRPGAGPASGLGYTGPVYAYSGQVAAPRPPRVTQHVRTLGLVWVCFGVYRVLGGLFGMFFLSAITSHRFGVFGGPFAGHAGFLPPWMGFFVPIVAVGTVISAALAFAAAYGLLNRTSWGRLVAIIAAVLALLKFPLGTVLGVYTLWVLAPRDSGAEYDHLASVSGR